jgi:adenosylcobinamide-phosphate synthase
VSEDKKGLLVLEDLFVVPLALFIDLTIGEYPASVHPVNWMGGIISLLLRTSPKKGPAVQLIYGILIVVATTALFVVPAFFLLFYLRGVFPVVYIIVAAILLKSTFSIKILYRSVNNVKHLLDARKTAQARKETRYLVSRDTAKLSKEQISSAIIEMTSESINDSIIAPLFYWIFFGVPGAVAYRVINTFDSRIGYHGQYEYLGKFAARLDDVLNYIPARISGILLVISAYIRRKNGDSARKIMVRYHGKTASPNAGWTMAATAGALDVRLEKPGHYVLGDSDKEPDTAAISDGLRLSVTTCILWFAISIGATGVHYALAA